MLSVGDIAPDFTARTQHGRDISLSDFRGQKVILYFYPKDRTYGCTKQACSLRDNYKELTDRGVVVLGVSGDNEDSHIKFADKHNLPFSLLVDDKYKIMKDYDVVWFKMKLFGKTHQVSKRSTFMIDEEGVIFHKIPRANTMAHGEEVLKYLDA